MKKTVSLLLVVVMLFASVSVMAADDVTVTLNGVPIAFDVPAQIVNGRTMVPMRKIFETLGAHVDWVEEHQGIVSTKGSKIIVMKVGSNLMVVSDVMTLTENQVTLDVPPMIIDSRTLVPVRAISESLGVKVDWIPETRTVVLTQ